MRKRFWIVILGATCLIFAPSVHAAITLDTSKAGAFGGGNPCPISYNYTVSGSNPILFTGISLDQGITVTSATYNSVPMTFVGSSTPLPSTTLYLYMLVGPSTGAHSVSVNCTAGNPNARELSASYDGVLQSGQPDASKVDIQATDPTNVSLTTNNANDWMIALSMDANSDVLSITAGGILRQAQISTATVLFDSNGSVGSAGSHTMTIEHTFSAEALSTIIAAFSPIPTVAPPPQMTFQWIIGD